MSGQAVAAQIIRACVHGIMYGEKERSADDFCNILSKLADELERADQTQPGFVRAGIAVEMPGTHGGFTMAVFEGRDVPVGTNIYIRRD